VQKTFIDRFPQAEIKLLIVWLKMYAADSLGAVSKGSRLFQNDPRVTQFYDPKKLSGVEIATGLGAQAGEIAWDVYLFYDGQSEWGDLLPHPVDWVHQLRGSSWAEPGRLFQGEQLTLKLQEIMENYIHN
jgi:hypothetical protein